jgi:lipopolysaccharide biosynthesis regulator YciM
LTRHELKEQLQHDRFSDAVSGAVVYASSHRKNLIRGGIAVAAIAAIVGIVLWYLSYQRSIRRDALDTALVVAQAPVGQATQFGKSFPTEQAKQDASIKALSEVVSKYGGSHEALIAQYYRGTIEAQKGDSRAAEQDLKTVANSDSEFAPVAKIALSQLYAGENRMSDAEALLRGIANKGSDLVSKAQANILLAKLYQTTNPQEAKKMLESLKSDKDPAVQSAVQQIAGEQTK